LNFLNPKEDVFDIELTSYGKYLLMSGKFQPEYYAFFDDDVVYSMNEEQNNIKDRIMEKTPIFNASTNIVSKQNTLNRYIEKKENNKIIGMNYEYLKNNNIIPIGSNKTTTDYIPAWEIKILKGTASNTEKNNGAVQFDMDDCEYNVSLKKKKEFASNGPGNYSSTELDSSTFLEIFDNYILLDITEQNVENLNENYELELFEVLPNDEFRRLVFNKKPDRIVDGILLDSKDLPDVTTMPDLSSRFVQHYFDILVDKEIDKFVIENMSKELQETFNTYTSNITPNMPTKDDC